MAGRISYYGNVVKDGLILNLDAAKKDSYAGSGTVWNDISGNNRTFTIVNSTTFGGNYIELPGSGSRIQRVENFDWSAIPFTLSSWVNMTDQTYPSVYDLILAGNGHLSLNASSTPNLDIRITGGGGVSVVSGGTILLNQWYNLVATREENNYKLYINGSLVGTGTSSVLVYDANMSGIYIGYSPDVDASTRTMNGKIGNAQIYNRALSATEVQQNYNALKSRFGL
jgi:hypothetical protein